MDAATPTTFSPWTLTDDQLKTLWGSKETGEPRAIQRGRYIYSWGSYNVLRAIEAYEAMRPPVKLPEWRDAVLDPPTEDDLASDGEVAVRCINGDVWTTDPAGIQNPGWRWMSLKLLVELPDKQYLRSPWEEEMDKFEAAFPGRYAFAKKDREYIDRSTQYAWTVWAKAKGIN